MSPARRLLLTCLALVAAVLLSVAVLARVLERDAAPVPAAAQDRPGPVLLVPGYGGSTASLEVLAGRLRAAGRAATIVRLPGEGTDDLRSYVEVVERAARQAVADGAPSVDVVGFSAGGVVARLWAQEDVSAPARRVVTLGSPHHGTTVAGLAARLAPGSCPPACLQLVPGSDLLSDLNGEDETPDGPQWLSLWTSADEVVTPPDSARLEGATNVELQDVCPGAQTPHGSLPRDPQVQDLVLQALAAGPLTAPAACPAASSG